MGTVKINMLGILLNLPMALRGLSGIRNFIHRQLTRRGVVSRVTDVELSSTERLLYLAKNISCSKDVWMFKKVLDIGAREIRSRKAKQFIEENFAAGGFNAVIQEGSLFRINNLDKLRSIPKFSYNDNNLKAYLKTVSSFSTLQYMKGRIAAAIDYEENVYKHLDVIFTMTEYLRTSFIEDYGIDERRVVNIGFGSNLNLGSDFVKKYDGRTILFVAKDSFREKGGYDVIEAFKKVKKIIHDVRMVIVGKKQNIDEDGIEFTGFIDKSTPGGEKILRKYYQEASLFVMPSYVEAAGAVFLEAMSQKLPCIGASVSAMPEIIVGNNCGFVVTPGNIDELKEKIIYLLRDEELLARYGDNGFRAVGKKYNWDYVCKRFLEVVNNYI